MTAMLSRKAPSLFWTLVEGRAVFEFNSFYALRLLMKRFPKGDGHPVITLPGFVASDASTRPMRGLLKDLGYETHGWGLGRNLVFNDEREAEMHDLLTRVHKTSGRKVSLVGWSLGGTFAREIAKAHPDAVRCVITLGSPISGEMDHTNARHIFEAINGKPGNAQEERFRTLNAPPPVPTTSIYSKTDGIVAWQGSIQHKATRTENIQIPASHFGLGVNPLVMFAIADRLSQPEGDWMPFETKGWSRALYKTPKV